MIFRVRGASTIHDFTLAAEACLPIIYAVLAEIKNKTYPTTCFLNIDLPTNVVNHKVNLRLAGGCITRSFLNIALPISIVNLMRRKNRACLCYI